MTNIGHGYMKGKLIYHKDTLLWVKEKAEKAIERYTKNIEEVISDNARLIANRANYHADSADRIQIENKRMISEYMKWRDTAREDHEWATSLLNKMGSENTIEISVDHTIEEED
jgi:hypothetical protein